MKVQHRVWKREDATQIHRAALVHAVSSADAARPADAGQTDLGQQPNYTQRKRAREQQAAGDVHTAHLDAPEPQAKRCLHSTTHQAAGADADAQAAAAGGRAAATTGSPKQPLPSQQPAADDSAHAAPRAAGYNPHKSRGGRASHGFGRHGGRGRHSTAAGHAGPSTDANGAAVHDAAAAHTTSGPGRGDGSGFHPRGRGGPTWGSAPYSAGRGRGRGRFGPAVQSEEAKQQAAAAAEEALKQKEQEMEKLKAKIRQQQAKQEAIKAAQQVQQQQQKQQQEMEQRKSRLNSAFGSAFAHAAKAQAEAKQQAAASAAAAAAAGGSDADVEEVKRVLGSKSHYEVLQLKPGCGSAALKKRYREMAVRLHPDKCKADHASDAFQRAHTAYQELLKVVI